MVQASEEVTPMSPLETATETPPTTSAPSPEELDMMGLGSSGGEQSVNPTTEVARPVSEAYKDGVRNYDPAAMANAEYNTLRLERDAKDPQRRNARHEDFMAQMVAEGMDPEQAMVRLGIGEEAADMEPAYLMDPVNIVADLATGGLQGAIKAGAGKGLAKAGVEAAVDAAGKSFFKTVGYGVDAIFKGTASGTWKTMMPVLPIIKGWQAVGGRELGKMALKEALKDAGIGLVASASMSGTEAIIGDGVTTVLSGIIGPMAAPALLRRFAKSGEVGITNYVINLYKNNPKVAVNLREGFEGLLEEGGLLNPRMGKSGVTPEAKAVSDSEVSLEMTSSLLNMKKAQDDALSQAAAANRKDVGDQYGKAAEGIANDVASKMRMDAEYALKKAAEATSERDVKKLEKAAAMKTIIAAVFENVPEAAAVKNQIADDIQDALWRADMENTKDSLDMSKTHPMNYTQDVANRHYPQWEGDKQLPEVDPLAPGKGMTELHPLEKQPGAGRIPGELPPLSPGKGTSELPPGASKNLAEYPGDDPRNIDWVSRSKNTLTKAREIGDLPKPKMKEPPSLSELAEVKIPVTKVNAPSTVNPGETKPAVDTGRLPGSTLPATEVKAFQDAVMSGDTDAVRNLLDINYDKIWGGDDIKQIIATAFENMPSLSRGTRSWDEAKQLAVDYDLKDLLKSIEDNKHLDSKVYGFMKIFDAHGQNLQVLSAKYQAAAAVGIVPPDLEVATAKAIKVYATLLELVKEQRASAGRTLNMFKTLGEFKPGMEGTLLMSQALKNEMSGELLDTVTRITSKIVQAGGSKKELKNVIKAASMSRTTGVFLEIVMGGYLSSFKTLFVNTIGPAMAITQTVGERLINIANKGFSPASRYEFGQFLKGTIEPLLPMSAAQKDALRASGHSVEPAPLDHIMSHYELAGETEQKAAGIAANNLIRNVLKLFDSPAIKIANESFSRRSGIIDGRLHYTHQGRSDLAEIAQNQKDAGHKFVGGAVGLIGHLVGGIGRGMVWTDGVFKSLAYSGETRFQAARMALKEGLEGDALDKRVNEIISEMPDELHNKAVQHARETAMQADPETKTMKAVSHALSANSFIRAAFFPFIRTGLNILKFSSERTPLINLMVKRSRDAIFGSDPAERSLALAKIELGGMLMATGFGMIASKMYTGAAPQDPEARRLWLQAGNQPHHLKLGDTLIDLRRFEPISTPFMMMGELVEAMNTLSDEGIEKASSIIFGVIHNYVEDRTMLSGMSNLMEGFDSADGLAKLVKSTAPIFVPLSSFNKSFNRAQDPFIREAWDAWEAIKLSVPGAGQTVPPRRTILGEAVQHSLSNIDGPSMKRFFSFEGAFNSMVNPATIGEAKEPNAYDEMARLAQVGTFAHRPIKNHLYVPDVGETVNITHEQYSELMNIMSTTPIRGGKTAREATEEFIKSPFYTQTLKNDIQKGEQLSRFVHSLRSVAVDKFLKKHPELRQTAIAQAKANLTAKLSPQQ